jgi:hypothetical protein
MVFLVLLTNPIAARILSVQSPTSCLRAEHVMERSSSRCQKLAAHQRGF